MTEHKTVSASPARMKIFDKLMDRDTTGIGFSAMLAQAAERFCEGGYNPTAPSMYSQPEVTIEHLHHLTPEEFKRHQVLVQMEAKKRLAR